MRPPVARVERKYCVPEPVAQHVLAVGRAFLPSDRGLEAPQPITSLYLDSPSLTFLRWHQSGRPTRFKLRLRRYGESWPGPVFLEIKRKAGEIGQKSRAVVPEGALEALIGAMASGEPLPHFDDAVARFDSLRRAFDAWPRILVRARRQSLRDDEGAGETAITIDRDVACCPVLEYDLHGTPGLWRGVDMPACGGTRPLLIEFKFVDHPPAWMTPLLRMLRPYRVKFSKYRASMEQQARWSHSHVRLRQPVVDTAGAAAGPVFRPVVECGARLHAP